MRRETGRPSPLGATIADGGVQFAIFSRNATSVVLCLFDDPRQAEPSSEIVLAEEANRTGDVWHVWLEGVGAGQFYLYKVDGPYEPEAGHRFNANLYLVDPYAKALTGGFEWELSRQFGYDSASAEGDLSFNTRADASGIPKCIVTDDAFDWQGDRPLNYPLRRSVIYEAHIKGLTAHPTSGVSDPGTYRGVTQQIPYLVDLGITSV